MQKVYANPIAQDLTDVINGYEDIFFDIKAAILEAEAGNEDEAREILKASLTSASLTTMADAISEIAEGRS